METSASSLDQTAQHSSLHGNEPPRRLQGLLDSESESAASRAKEARKRCKKDPHGLAIATPWIFAAYRFAHDAHDALVKRTIDEEGFSKRLITAAPKSPFRFSYVAHQTFKLINPHGHGANGPRFRNETLAWFRETFPEDERLTAGFALVVCAAKWWTHEQGHRSVTPNVRALTILDLDRKLPTWGFVESERKAIRRLLRNRRP